MSRVLLSRSRWVSTGVEQADDVVVDVADEGLVVGVDDGAGVALEVEGGVAGADQDAAKVDELGA